jgi:hypothetical protein
LAVHGGGAAVLPLPALFDGIAKNPGAPEYWWIYAFLFSTISRSAAWPSCKVFPAWGPSPELDSRGRDMPEYKRPPAAIGLTSQIFAGVALGIAAQAFLAWGLIFHVMPWIGLDLLDMARAVAAFDLPARIGQLFAGYLALK